MADNPDMDDHEGGHGCGVTHDDITNGRYTRALEIAFQRLHGNHIEENLVLIGDELEVGMCHMMHLMPSAVHALMHEIQEGDGPQDPSTVLVAIFQAGIFFGRALQELDGQTICSNIGQDGLPTIKAGLQPGVKHAQM